MVVSGSSDGTIKCWDVQTGACLTTLAAPRPYEGMNITGVTGISDAQKVALQAWEHWKPRMNRAPRVVSP